VLLAFCGRARLSIGLSAILSHFLAAASATNTVILLVGMAVGVDYSLFYLKRERENGLRASMRTRRSCERPQPLVRLFSSPVRRCSLR